jgi:hypothetical protein
LVPTEEDRMTDEAEGRERLRERAREEDLGERGERDPEGGAERADASPAERDPLLEARAEQAPPNTARDEGDPVPGNTETMERWEREKRMGRG